MLLICWLVLFTIGSQIDSGPYKKLSNARDFLMFILTNRETSVTILAIVASCLGTWRAIHLNPARLSESNRPGVAYISGAISGLFFGVIVVACPMLLTGIFPQLTIERDPRNDDVFAVIGSFVGFISGYDPNVFDRWVVQFSKRIEGDSPVTPGK